MDESSVISRLDQMVRDIRSRYTLITGVNYREVRDVMPQETKDRLFDILINGTSVDLAWQIVKDFRASLPEFMELRVLREEAHRLGLTKVDAKSRKTLIRYINENSKKPVQQTAKQDS